MIKLKTEQIAWLYCKENRRDIPEGHFGALAPYRCACGPVWKEPITICVSRGSDYEPREYDWMCPICGRRAINENDEPRIWFRSRRKYKKRPRLAA